MTRLFPHTKPPTVQVFHRRRETFRWASCHDRKRPSGPRIGVCGRGTSLKD